MIITRRFFIGTLITAATTISCALRGRTRSTSTLFGHVFTRDTGLRLGRSGDMRTPGVPVTLEQQIGSGNDPELNIFRVVAKQITNSRGEFHFTNIPPGVYIVRCLRGDAKLCDLTRPDDHVVGLFQYRS